MGNFNKGGKFGGHSFHDRDGDRPALHKAICTDCGKPCEVPFKPMPGKPVFCSNCFKKDGDGGKFEKRGFGKKEFGRGGFEDRPMFEAVCAKCGETCQVPFKPNGEKPVLCKGCFAVAKGDSFSTGKSDQFAKSFGARRPEHSSDTLEKMNAKLERILKMLEALAPKKEGAKEVVKKEATKEVMKEVPKKEVKAKKPAKVKKAAKPAKAKKVK